jgi:hypothetical protein
MRIDMKMRCDKMETKWLQQWRPFLNDRRPVLLNDRVVARAKDLVESRITRARPLKICAVARANGSWPGRICVFTGVRACRWAKFEIIH